MILDTSVIVAISLREPGYEQLVDRLRSADTIGIGTPTLVEAGMVLSARLGVEPQALLDRFLRAGDTTGVTLNDCGRWFERNTGVQLKKPDMKSVPHPSYSPVVMPGK